MHITQNIDDNLRTVVEQVIDSGSNASVAPIYEALHERSRQIIFHEFYHFWQSLRLPFLCRYAQQTLLIVVKTFIDLSSENKDHNEWKVELPELHRFKRSYFLRQVSDDEIDFGEEKLLLESDSLNLKNWTRLTVIDLLETAASLAEFQISPPRTKAADLCDPIYFNRWRKRNPSREAIFDFVAKFMQSQTLTLRFLLPLINACFYTNFPELAFVHLLARARARLSTIGPNNDTFLSQEEPCRWDEVFAGWLNELPYNAPADYSSDLSDQDDFFYQLTTQTWLEENTKNSFGLQTHPIIGNYIDDWLKDEKTAGPANLILGYPGYLNAEQIQDFLNKFSPPITILRVHADAIVDKDVLITYGKLDMASSIFVPLDYIESDVRGIFIDLLTMYSAVSRAAQAHYDEEQRNCYHKLCPYYEANYCSLYTIIPARYETCGFPKRLSRLINQTDRSLLKVIQSHADLHHYLTSYHSDTMDLPEWRPGFIGITPNDIKRLEESKKLLEASRYSSRTTQARGFQWEASMSKLLAIFKFLGFKRRGK